MRIAAIQHDIVWEDGEQTRKAVEPMIATAAAGGARLIALTEMYATGFSMHPERIAEPVGGPNERFLIDQARQHDAWLVASVAQYGADGRARNVAILAAPDGSTWCYDKIHPFSHDGEDVHYAAGTEFCTVDVEGLRVSLFICYDVRFADEFWALAPNTDLYVVVANWPSVRREHWSTLLRARAIENQAYVVGVNRVGQTRSQLYTGDSAIIDPLGQVLAAAAVGESVLFADAEPETVLQVRDNFRFLQDRRTVPLSS